MGAAAYGRGTACLNRQLDAEQDSAELTLMRDLTQWSAAHDGRVVFQPTVIRFTGNGDACLMSKEHTGWSAFCYSYPSVWALAREWRLAFVGIGLDKHSRFFRVAPIPQQQESR